METTVSIDDELFAKATALARPGMGASELLRECLRAFIERETARRLAALGGHAPNVEVVRRRRDEPTED